MAKTVFCILKVVLLLSSSTLSSQSIELKFKGIGASNIIDSIKIENINLGTVKTINGDEVLLLNNIDSVPPPKNITEKPVMQPNPMTDYTVFDFYSNEKTIIEILNESGKSMAIIQNTLEEARHTYRIEGLPEGRYIVKLITPTYTYTDTLISHSNTGINLNTNIIYLSNHKAEEKFNRYSNIDVSMGYRSKDFFKLTAYSGDNTTIKVLQPKKDKVVVFHFAQCRDAEDNNYSIVKIGNQLWMAENLRATQFNDSTEITFIADPKLWGATNLPAYSWYQHNKEYYMNTYGALYNWYVVDAESNGNRNICPVGWQIPNSNEWRDLINHLGGASIAGGKIKESIGGFWDIEKTTFLNSSGFSALPAGNRFLSGAFDNIGKRGYWWSNTEYYAAYAWSNILFFSPMDVLKNNYLKNYGFSIRCIRY